MKAAWDPHRVRAVTRQGAAGCGGGNARVTLWEAMSLGVARLGLLEPGPALTFPEPVPRSLFAVVLWHFSVSFRAVPSPERGMSLANISGGGKTRMKAVSLCQPYASLIAAGVKTIETRGWAPPKGLMGQRIAIHAAKAIETADVRGRSRHDLIAAALNDPEWEKNVPRGAVVCTAVLDSAALVTGSEQDGQATAANRHPVPVDEWGDFGPGRWLWFLRDVEPVDPPAPARGHQGFWNWEHEGGTLDTRSDEARASGQPT